MRRRPLTDSPLVVSDLGLGTADIGIAEGGGEFDALVNRYREAGGNLLDTAHCYGFWRPDGAGCSERAIAGYLRRNGRGDLLLSTKGGHPSAGGYRKVDRYLAPQRVEADLQDSLARLSVDVIDLYWLHRDDPREPVGAVVDMMHALVKRGLIRCWGASNWTRQRIEQANAYARGRGLSPIVASQPMWSLAEHPNPGEADTRMTDADDLAWHERTQLPLFPWNSTARGYFATGGARADDRFRTPVNAARLERARRLAQQLGCTPNQVALAYLLCQPFPVFPLLGTRRLEHLNDAMGAAAVRLAPAQVAWLRDGDAPTAR